MVTVIRETPVKLPPIKRIEFESVYGKPCKIDREGAYGGQIVIWLGDVDAVIGRKTASDIHKYLGEMLKELNSDEEDCEE